MWDELLFAEQKILIHCEEMSKWECAGDQFNVGNVCLCEDDFVQINGKYILKPEVRQSRNHFCRPCLKTKSLIILSYPAYCRYHAVRARLLSGAALSRPLISALGGIIAKSRGTRIAFCRENFYHPEIENFSFSSGIKAPVFKGRPRKKTVKGITLSKALKKRKALSQLINNLPKHRLYSESQISDTESVDTVQSDISEESIKSRFGDKTSDYENVEIESDQMRLDESDDDVKSDKSEENFLKEFCALETTTKIDVIKEESFVDHRSPPPMQNNLSDIDFELLHIFKSDKKRKCIEDDSDIPMKKEKLEKFVDQNENISLKDQKQRSDFAMKYVEELQTPVNESPVKKEKPQMIMDLDENIPLKNQEQRSDCNIKYMGELKTSVGEIPIKKEKVERFMDHNENISLKDQQQRSECPMKYMEELKKPGNLNSAEERKFMDSLLTFMNSRKTPIGKIPALGFKKVNLFALFSMAQSLGGYEQVTEKRMWRRLYKDLGGHTTITSAATTLRRHYERLLLPYEQYIKGRTIPTKDENKSVDSPIKKEFSGGLPTVDISEENKALVKNILSDRDDFMYSPSKVQESSLIERKVEGMGQEQKATVLVNKGAKSQNIPVVAETPPKKWKSEVFDNKQEQTKSVDLQDFIGKFSASIDSSKIEVLEKLLPPVHVPAIVRNSSVKQPPKLIESTKTPSPKVKEQLRVRKPNNCTPPMPKLVKITDKVKDMKGAGRTPWKQVIEIGSDTEGSCDSDDNDHYGGIIQQKRSNGNLYHSKDSYIQHDIRHEQSVSPLIQPDKYVKQERIRSPYQEKRCSRPNILSRSSPLKENLQNDIEMAYLSFPVMDSHGIVDNLSVVSLYSPYCSTVYGADSPPLSTGSLSPKQTKSRIFMPQYQHNMPSISSPFMPAYETPSPSMIHPGHCLVGSPHSYHYVHGIPVASPSGSIY